MDRDPFLLAIREAPEEVAPRLVYADWLDENDEAAKAEYLRLVQAVAERDENAPERRQLVKRLLRVAKTIDVEWRDAAGAKFDVILEGWLGGAMFVFLRAVRWFTGAQGRGAMEPVDASHSVVLRSGMRREEAEIFLYQVDRQRFRREPGARQSYRIVPSKPKNLIAGTQAT